MPSAESVRRQIPKLAKEWRRTDLCPVQVHDSVHLGWKRPTKVPLETLGFSVLLDVEIPFCSLEKSRFQDAMRNRVRMYEKDEAYLQYELHDQMERAAFESEQEAVDHEFRADMRNLIRDRKVIGAGSYARRSTNGHPGTPGR